MSPFIELGVGFNQEMAARDNVILNGVMLGLTPREARERVDEIIAFAELEDFVDLKLKNYSSGMQVRLAFAVMVQVDADVLLIDEVLAVGDAAFQQKCFDVFFRLRDEGKTIVLVTHDMAAVERFCHRAVLLEEGRVVGARRPVRGGRPLHGHELRAAAPTPTRRRSAASAAATAARGCWRRGSRTRTASARTPCPRAPPCVFRARVRFNEDAARPRVLGGLRRTPSARTCSWPEGRARATSPPATRPWSA